MKYDEQIQALLTEHGAVLKRDKRHLVYTLPSGQVFTMAKTPSDERAAANALSDLRRVLGLVDPERGKPGERRPRKAAGPEHKPRVHAAPLNTALADQLRAHGVEADALRQQIAELTAETVRLVEYAQIQANKRADTECDLLLLRREYRMTCADRDLLEKQRRACWVCRLRDWWRNR